MRRRAPRNWPTEATAQEQLRRQKQHDSFLLATYTSVKDIEQLRDERLLQVHGQRVAAEQYVASVWASACRRCRRARRLSSPTAPGRMRTHAR